MTVRMSMYIRDGSSGKTESFYTNLAVAPAITAGRLLAEKRAALLTPICDIFLVGARDLTNPRLSDADWDLPGFQGTASARRADIKNAAEEIRLLAGTHISRPWLHGLPDSWVEAPSDDSPARLTATGITAVDAYLTFLVNQGTWMLRSITAGAPTGAPVADITVAAGIITFKVPGNTFAAGDLVKITGAKGYHANKFNGTWRVGAAPTDPTFTVSSTRAYPGTFSYIPNSAKIRRANKPDYGYNTIESAKRLRIGTRRMGRIPLVPAGRQSGSRR